MPTQAEAKQMWCPFARVLAMNGAAYNRNQDRTVSSPIAQTECIGAACMGWRWASGDQQPRRLFVSSTADAPWDQVDEPERPLDLPASYTWHPPTMEGPGRWLEPDAEYEARRVRDRVGFCGLAG